MCCNSNYVPDIIICTIDPPNGLKMIGKPELLQTRVLKFYHPQSSLEKLAQSIAEKVFFIEYSLHTQMVTKLKLQGKNAVFGLRTKISVGPNYITGVATGTGVFLDALPISAPLKVEVTAH